MYSDGNSLVANLISRQVFPTAPSPGITWEEKLFRTAIDQGERNQFYRLHSAAPLACIQLKVVHKIGTRRVVNEPLKFVNNFGWLWKDSLWTVPTLASMEAVRVTAVVTCSAKTGNRGCCIAIKIQSVLQFAFSAPADLKQILPPPGSWRLLSVKLAEMKDLRGVFAVFTRPIFWKTVQSLQKSQKNKTKHSPPERFYVFCFDWETWCTFCSSSQTKFGQFKSEALPQVWEEIGFEKDVWFWISSSVLLSLYSSDSCGNRKSQSKSALNHWAICLKHGFDWQVWQRGKVRFRCELTSALCQWFWNQLPSLDFPWDRWTWVIPATRYQHHCQRVPTAIQTKVLVCQINGDMDWFQGTVKFRSLGCQHCLNSLLVASNKRVVSMLSRNCTQQEWLQQCWSKRHNYPIYFLVCSSHHFQSCCISHRCASG